MNKFYFILILILCIFVRFWGLSDAELGADAIDQIYKSDNTDFISVINEVRISHQGSAPLDFIILHYWMKIAGKSNFAVQVPAAVFGIICVIFVFLTGRLLFSSETALWAMFIISLSPFHIYFSQEARFYSLACLMSMIILWAMVRVLKNDRMLNWIILFIVSVLGLYSHFFSAFILLIGWLWLCIKIFFISDKNTGNKEKNILLKLTIVGILSFISFSPWFFKKVAVEYKQATSIFGIEALKILWYTYAEFCGTHFINRSINYFAVFAGTILIFFGIIRINKQKNESYILITGIPVISASILYICYKYVYFPTTRQWLFLLPWFILIQAVGIVSLRKIIKDKLTLNSFYFNYRFRII